MKPRMVLGWVLLLANVVCQSGHPLEQLDQTKLRSLIHERDGKILFINIWATWCAPCMKEFPAIVRLAGEYAGKPVTFVGVTADDPEDVQSKVTPFLVKTDPQFRIYLARIDGNDNLINEFGDQWTGAIPATFIYDTKGRMRKLIVGERSYSEFKSTVDSLLAERR